METKSIIQSAANVVRLVNLKKGDIFKIVGDEGFSGDRTHYAVVVNVLNDGENTFIEVLEYEKSYNEVKAEFKIYKGTDNISIFPTKIEEVKGYFSNAIEGLKTEIEESKKELQNKIESLKKAEEFAEGELSKQLSEAEFKEQTQVDYEKEKAIKKAKKEELEQG